MVSAEAGKMSCMDSPSRRVTVVDIYDLAAVIGKDFERLIDLYGSETFTDLLPKVISALELLESFAGRNERENQEIDRLNLAVSRLEADKLEKKEGILKFQQELEQIEENYKAEIHQLVDLVRKLREENQRLSKTVELKESPPVEALTGQEVDALFSLRETVEHQRDKLRQIGKNFNEKTIEAEKLQESNQRLEHINKDLLRKYKAVRYQGRCLVEEKAELISRLQSAERLIGALQLRLGQTEKEQKEFKEKREEDDSSSQDHVPKFTLAELREVLQEKNALKARVMELEEELSQLKTVTNLPNTDAHILSTSKGEDEILVYGPINKEPDEKLYPWKYSKKDAGVRNFFRRMLKTSD